MIVDVPVRPGLPAGAAATIQPAAVAGPVVDLVTGPLRPATILAAHGAALVLCLEPPPPDRGPARVVVVLTADASGVPNGVRTALRAADRPFADIVIGDAAFLGAGRVDLPGLTLRAVRTVRTAVPHLTPAAGAAGRIADAARAAPRGVADAPVEALRAALASGSAAQVRHAVRSLVGLGTGSTPGGDDVLAGTLAGLHATRRAVLAEQIGAAALPDLDSRTPLLSADLLRLAARGHVCTEAGAVLRAAAGPAGASGTARGELDRALTALIAIGHTSGADLATGLAVGLGVPAQPPPRPPRHRPGARERIGAHLRSTDRPHRPTRSDP